MPSEAQSVGVGDVPEFATFWSGQGMTAFELACLSSFVRHGYAVTVYGYEAVHDLPDGVSFQRADDIVDRRFVDAFLIKGRPSLSHFSDLFRYRLFQNTRAVWIDSDMYLLRPFDLTLPPTLLAREDTDTLCGAIMRLDSANPALTQLVERTEAVAGRNLEWGETGPRLLTAVFGAEALAQSFGPDRFFPVHYDDFWKVLLPEFSDECRASCRDGYTLHLWNNIVTKVGVWKDVLPPEGSYLHQVFTDDGLGGLFQGTFPAGAMRHVIDNYRMRMSGNFGDVSKLARLAIPGLRRRMSRHVGRAMDRIGVR